MTEKTPLSIDVYLALAAIGWADGNLDREEADAIARTALEDGLEFDQVTKLEETIETRVEIGSIDWRAMCKEDRLFVYAIASWMTRLDHEVTDEEVATLNKLGDALHVPEAPREHADNIAIEVANMPEGDRPFRFDITKLRELITTRLRAAQESRAAGATEEQE